jgi:DNA-binding XRE family transcriptional regulator
MITPFPRKISVPSVWQRMHLSTENLVVFHWEYSFRNILLGIQRRSSVEMEPQSKNKPDLTSIGDRIRKLRGEILQDELALQLGISQGQLSKIERGLVAPGLEVLLCLANQFRTSIDWIVRGEARRRK